MRVKMDDPVLHRDDNCLMTNGSFKYVSKICDMLRSYKYISYFFCEFAFANFSHIYTPSCNLKNKHNFLSNSNVSILDFLWCVTIIHGPFGH